MIVIIVEFVIVCAVFSPFLFRALRHLILRRRAARLPAALINSTPDRIGSIRKDTGSFVWSSDLTIDCASRKC
jgi:hypothetical protein